MPISADTQVQVRDEGYEDNRGQQVTEGENGNTACSVGTQIRVVGYNGDSHSSSRGHVCGADWKWEVNSLHIKLEHRHVAVGSRLQLGRGGVRAKRAKMGVENKRCMQLSVTT